MDKITKQELYNQLKLEIDEVFNKNVEYYKQFKITKRDIQKNIFIIDKYLKRLNVCRSCDKYENCKQNDNRGYIYKLLPEKNDIWNVTFTKCNKKISHDMFQEMTLEKSRKFIIADFPKDIFFINKKNLLNTLPISERKILQDISKGRNTSDPKNYLISLDVDKIDKFTYEKNCILLAIDIANDATGPICYIDLIRCINDYKNHDILINNKTSNYATNNQASLAYDLNGPIKDCPFIFFTNVGSESEYLPWFHNNIFLNLINYRYNAGLKTYFITRLNKNTLYKNFKLNPKNSFNKEQISLLIDSILKK